MRALPVRYAFLPRTISATHQRYDDPPTGYNQNFQRLYGSRNYHDDLWGYFEAQGYTYAAGYLHTGHWNRCSTQCRYYEYYYRDPYA